MRDVNRIEPFLNKIKEMWYIHPDYRFGQLVSVLEITLDRDIFYAEEKDLLKFIQKEIDKNNIK